MNLNDAIQVLMSIENLTDIQKEAVTLVIEKIINVIKHDDLPNEEWKDIENYEGIYQVSNFGRIKSFHEDKIRICKPSISNMGYLKVTLCKNGVKKSFAVHILVARAFILNPENKPQVNHKNCDKLNCTVDNLEWVTNGENQSHAWKMGVKKPLFGERSPHAKLTNEEVKQIREMYKWHDKEFNQHTIAKMFGVSPATINSIVRGKTYTK